MTDSNAHAELPSIAASSTQPSTLTVGVGAFGVYHLVLALFMAVAPHTFFEQIGPFGVANSHYIRDTASYNGAIGVALLLAVSRHSWRTPVLALTTLQFALHCVNHLIDINRAHPAWNGYADFFSLLAATLLLAWLLRLSRTEARHLHPSPKGSPQ